MFGSMPMKVADNTVKIHYIRSVHTHSSRPSSTFNCSPWHVVPSIPQCGYCICMCVFNSVCVCVCVYSTLFILIITDDDLLLYMQHIIFIHF